MGRPRPSQKPQTAPADRVRAVWKVFAADLIQRQNGVRGFILLTARSEFHLSALSRSARANALACSSACLLVNISGRFCQLKASGHHQMEYTMQASRTALRIIVTTPATSRMEIFLGSNAMPAPLEATER